MAKKGINVKTIRNFVNWVDSQDFSVSSITKANVNTSKLSAAVRAHQKKEGAFYKALGVSNINELNG